MKILKYLGIFLAIAGMFYAKSKIDARNKSNIEAIDNLDEGTETPKVAIKKKGKGVIHTP